MKHRKNALAKFLWDYPFGVLLIAILLMIVGSPLVSEASHDIHFLRGPSGLAPLTILLTAAATFAIWNRGSHRRAIGIFIFGSVITCLAMISFFLREQPVLDMLHLFGQAFFLGFVGASLLRTVFRARIVDGNILCGAACIYLLTGAICGYVFAMLQVFDHTSFQIVSPFAETENRDLYREPGWLVYFSYTTLTTVGFGDILPANALARSVAVLEAVIGQIMLVVVMARLVGLHVAHSTTSRHRFQMTSDEDK